MPGPKDKLSSKDRVRLALNHKPVDRVPKGEIVIEGEAVAQFLGTAKADFWHKLEFAGRIGLDIICLHPDYPDPQGNMPKSEAVRWPELRDWVDKSNLFTFAVLDGILGWGSRVFGYADFLVLSRRSPQVFQGFVGEINRFNTDLAKRMANQGVDGIILADDLAHQRGLVFSPDAMRKYFFPAFACQVAEISREGVPVFLHSDGDLNLVMGDIVEAGFHGLHCIDPNAGMDIVKLQEQFGRKLCLWGSLSVEDLQRARDGQVEQTLVEGIQLLSGNTGFILGTTSGIFPGMETDSLEKIYRKVDGR